MSTKRDDDVYARDDRRVERTQAMLIASFDGLLFEKGFGGVRVSEVTVNAGVGRSTFYEHFEGKDDLLAYSVAGPLAAIAAAALSRTTPDILLDVMEHIQAQQRVVSALLTGSTRAILVRALALKLESHLAALSCHAIAPPIAPLALIALSLAYTQIGAIDAWLSCDDRCDAKTAVRLLRSITQAGVHAAFARGERP